ncbi:phytoene desaturase [bacterium]|nr:MAG: phytoene desaturase [bacterium]
MHCIVIGAGIGGLVSASLLAAKGNEVTLFEAGSLPGGKMSEIRLGDYRFDSGPSLFTMPFILDDVFKTCGKELSDYMSISPLEPLCRYIYPDGTRFDNFSDLSKTLEQIRSFSPEDEENYVRFLGKSAELYAKTAQAFLFNPLAEWSDFKTLNFKDLLSINAFATVSESVERAFISSYLKQFFKRFTTYNGSSPYKAPATLNVIPYVELAQGGFYVKGGLFQLAKAIEKLALDLGVSIQYNQPVQQIEVKNKKAIGVSISKNGDNRFVKADCVISNADSVYTYTKLLSDKHVKSADKKRFEALEPSCSGFVLQLGINRTYSLLKHHTIFFSSDYKKEFDEIFSERKPAEEPTIYIANTSFSEDGHAPQGHSNLFILVNAPYTHKHLSWNELKESYAEKIIQLLKANGLVDLEKHIISKNIITPDDFEKNYNTNRGSIYGLSSNSRYAAFLRPRNRSSYAKNLYLVGGGTHPGGGIPLVTLSAKHAVSLIERDFK